MSRSALHLATAARALVVFAALALQAPAETAPERPSPTLADVDASLLRGVDFLLTHQNPDGSWGGPTLTKDLNIYAPLPGGHHAFRAGTSGLALSGILDVYDPRPQTKAATDRAAAWMAEHLPKLRRADTTTTYNTWGHAYGLRAITRLYRTSTDPATKERLANLAREQIQLVSRYEEVNGGWGYLDIFDGLATQKPSGLPTSFTTATVLLAMREAAVTMDLKLDDKLTNHALEGIRQQRLPDFSYTYSFAHRMRPRADINRPAGSLSRSQSCNACLRLFGDPTITDAVITTWSDRFLAREGFLANGRKRPVPHEAPFGIAGYFYYYGVFYFTESTRLLPPQAQPEYARKLAAILLERQEKDGSWWDYPLYNYHTAYGTGYALMSLSWCREVMARSAP